MSDYYRINLFNLHGTAPDLKKKIQKLRNPIIYLKLNDPE